MNCFGRLAVYLSRWFHEPVTNKLASFIILCLFKAASLSWKWVKKKKIQSSETIETGQRVPKHLDNCGHVEHRTSIPPCSMNS